MVLSKAQLHAKNSFPNKMRTWDWERWKHLSENSRKLDKVLSCCPCVLRGWHTSCNCEFEDEQKWLKDFLYVRRFEPPCVRPVTKDGAMVIHPDGFIMGPYTYKEWLSYCFDLFDYCHEVAAAQKPPDWNIVFFRHNDDFVGGHFRYFYPITLIMIHNLEGLANKHGAANDASRGVDLFETLQPKDLDLSDVLRRQGHMVTCPMPHLEFLQDVHKIDPDQVDTAKCAEKITRRNLKYKKRVKLMRKKNKKLSWSTAMHYLPERAQKFSAWYPKIKNVPVWFDFKTKKWQLPYFYTDKKVEDSHPVLFNETIQKWLASGALIMLKEGEEVDLITPNVLANVQKENGPPIEPGKKPRLCHDGGFEKNIEKYSFPCKLDDLRTLQKMTKHLDQMCISDDQRGFHQQLLSRESRKLTAFSYKGKIFVYRVSPFGSPKIPSVFQRANKIPVNYARSLGARVNLYLDDRITLDQPENVINGVSLSAFLSSCMSICAGGFISIAKSDFEPKTRQQFLGMVVDSKECTISVPEEKWKLFKETIERYLEQNFCTFKELEKLRGKAVSFILANPKTKLFIRVMNSTIARLNKEKRHATTKISFSEKLKSELEEWIKLDHLQMCHKWLNSYNLESPPHRVTFTDASSFSGAAIVFDGEHQAWHCQWMFDEKIQPMGIFYKEAISILWMLLEFEEELSDKTILHFCDNESVVAAFSNLGSKVESMNSVVTDIYHKLHKMRSNMKVFWISTHYQLADGKSRQIDWNEEYLPSMYFHKLCRLQRFFPKLDAMATLANTKCEQYITLGRDFSEKCIAYDFFSYPPSKLKNIPFYIFPPKNILNSTAHHLWCYYKDHEWMLVFHSFGDIPPAIAPLLKITEKVELTGMATVVPAEKQLKIGEELHWGFKNNKPAKTFALICRNKL